MDNKKIQIVTFICLIISIIGIINLRIEKSKIEAERDAYKVMYDNCLISLRKANTEIKKANRLYGSGLIINLTDIK